MPLSCADERGFAGCDRRRGGPPTPVGDRPGMARDRPRRRGAQQRRRRPLEPDRQTHHRPLGAPAAIQPAVFGPGRRIENGGGDARPDSRRRTRITFHRSMVRYPEARATQAADPHRQRPGAVLPDLLRARGDERPTDAARSRDGGRGARRHPPGPRPHRDRGAAPVRGKPGSRRQARRSARPQLA